MTEARMSRFALTPAALAGSGWLAIGLSVALGGVAAAGWLQPGYAVVSSLLTLFYASGVAMAAGVLALVAAFRIWRRDDLRGYRWTLVGLGAALGLVLVALVPVALAVIVIVAAIATAIVAAITLGPLLLVPAPMGRPLPDGAVAPVRPDTHWGGDGHDDPIRRDLWRDRALDEHAAIPAFAQLALELVALGAPPDLVDDALHSARQEVDHARRAFELAGPVGPGPLPVVDTDRVRVAVASLRDGCLGEGFAAAVAAAEVERCDGAEAELLADIARDEAEHAEVGWRTLAWCLSSGDAEVHAAVGKALRELPVGGYADSEVLRPLEVQRLYRRVRRQVVTRAAALLARHAPDGALTRTA